MNKHGKIFRFLSLIFICLLVVSLLAACQQETEPATDDQEPEESTTDDNEDTTDDTEDTPPVEISGWKNPTEPIEIIDDFERLKWVWSNVEQGVETDSTEVIYEYLGTEEIDGAETDVIYFTAKGDEAKIWIDKNGDAAKVNVNGETIPTMIADQALETVLQAVFMPFEQVENQGIYDFLTDEYDDAVWTSVSEEEATFGDQEATVTSIEVTVGPPFREVERGTAIWEIADFGTFQMVSGYSWKDYEEEGTYVSYELKDVSLR